MEDLDEMWKLIGVLQYNLMSIWEKSKNIQNEMLIIFFSFYYIYKIKFLISSEEECFLDKNFWEENRKIQKNQLEVRLFTWDQGV